MELQILLRPTSIPLVKYFQEDTHSPRFVLRVRETGISYFRIPPSGQLGPIFTRTILSVGFATPAVMLPQVDPIWPKFWREFWDVLVARTLSDVSHDSHVTKKPTPRTNEVQSESHYATF